MRRVRKTALEFIHFLTAEYFDRRPGTTQFKPVYRGKHLKRRQRALFPKEVEKGQECRKQALSGFQIFIYYRRSEEAFARDSDAWHKTRIPRLRAEREAAQRHVMEADMQYDLVAKLGTQLLEFFHAASGLLDRT